MPALVLMVAALVGGLAVPVGAQSAATRELQLIPATDLVDGEVVVARWRGFPPGGNEVLICAQTIVDPVTHCTPSFGGVTGSNGNGAAAVKVAVGDIDARSPDPSITFKCDADHPCQVVVQASDDPSIKVAKPITFAASTRALQVCADSRPPVLLTGTGDSSLTRAFDRWILELCQPPRNAAVDFNNRSATEARFNFIARLEDFSASPRPFTPEEMAQLRDQGRDGDFVYVPIAGSALGIVYNAWYRDPGEETFSQIRDLCLSAEAVAKIFTGQMPYLFDGQDRTVLDDNPQIEALGLGPILSPVEVVARADASYDNYLLTSWIQSDPKAATAWRRGGPAFEGSTVTETFPPSIFIDVRTLTKNVITTVLSAKGEFRSTFIPRGHWFAYMDVTLARRIGLPVARLKNADGECVAPTGETIGAAFARMKTNPDGVTQSPDFAPTGAQAVGAAASAPAYPLPVINYLIVPTRGLAPEKVPMMKTVVDYVIGEGQAGLRELGYVPLPASVMETAKAQAAKVPATAPAPTVTVPESSGDFGLFDNPLIIGQPILPSVTPIIPAATTAATAAKTSAPMAFSFVRYVGSGAVLPALGVIVVCAGSLLAGLQLRRKARAAGGAP
jgi:phosphate transport system substrate-binding protein